MIDYSDDRKPALGAVIDLYRSVDWSSADKPDALHKGLLASHTLVTAWAGEARLMTMMMARYRGFHQQSLLADGRAVGFYKKLGFTRAGSTEPLWIFDGHEHD